MTVANHETVSCFIQEDKWSTTLNRPMATAFKRVDLSVWREEKLKANGASMDDLRIESFVGCRYVSYVVEHITQMANEAGLSVQVLRRTEDEYVKEPWRPWRYAHAQIESTQQLASFPSKFRLLLANHARLPDAESAENG